MLHSPNANSREIGHNMVYDHATIAGNPSNVGELDESHTAEVLVFLTIRPVHTVVMTSFINDNGIVSELNRGKFYGYRNTEGKLEGVALIGHTTLVEAFTDAALAGLASVAKNTERRIHLIMSNGDAATTFWNYLSNGLTPPRLTCVERHFEAAFPLVVQHADYGLRLAEASELLQIAEAQAHVALIESGVDPMFRDRDGFLRRVARRIEQERVFVVFDGDNLVFKADIIAETPHVAYLEGIYVGPKFRGKGVGHKCLAALTVKLLSRVASVCMLSNVNFETAHRCFQKAGFRGAGTCTTLFV